MKTWSALLACIILVLGVAVFLKIHSHVAGQTIGVYGVYCGPSERLAQYFDKAATAFDAHLKSMGFAVTTRPASIGDSGAIFAAQRETWYVGNHRGAQVYVRVRVATDNAAALDVDVSWRAEGLTSRIDSVRTSAHELRDQLTAWFAGYERANPAPWTPKKSL